MTWRNEVHDSYYTHADPYPEKLDITQFGYRPILGDTPGFQHVFVANDLHHPDHLAVIVRRFSHGRGVYMTCKELRMLAVALLREADCLDVPF
jgi:hypothetical protein